MMKKREGEPVFLPQVLAFYGARHLVTATLDSGQIGGGIFFFFEIPQWGAAGKIF